MGADGEDVTDVEKGRILPNAAFAVLQVLVTSATLFLLYRFLLSSLGIEALGLWALVVAATSLANVSNLGFAGGAVRFVSKHLARGDDRSAADAVETATLSVAAAMALAILLLYPASGWLLGLVVPAKSIPAAHELLPYTLAGLWLNSVGGAVYSGLDGCHRADRRSLATIATQPLLLVLAVWLVPKFGLKGLAYAQILQYLVWICIGWLLLKKQLPQLSSIPFVWSRTLFKEMWRYGLSFQVISILTLLSEPVAKGLLSQFGALTAVGYFEMANRLTSQVRSLLVSANQVLVPYYSKIGEVSRGTINTLYKKNLNTTVLLGSVAFSTLLGLTPLIARVWIGHLEEQFLHYAALLVVGHFTSLLGAPAYICNVGIGRLSHNLQNHLVIALAIPMLAVPGGLLLGGLGCVLAYSLSLMLGTLVLVVQLHRDEGLALRDFVSAWNARITILSAAFAAAGFFSYLLVLDRFGGFDAGAVSAFLVSVGLVLCVLLVPDARDLLGVVRDRVRRRTSNR